MAEEENEVEGKPKKPIVKILIIALAVILLLGGAVGGTLFATGFFDKKPAPEAEDQAEHGGDEHAKAEDKGHGKADDKGHGKADDKGHGKGEKGKDGKPEKLSKKSPELQRFDTQYMELPRELLANVTNSRKVIQCKVGFSTHYDDRVFENAKKHEIALTSAALDIIRQTTDADIAKPTFRKELAEKLLVEFNAVLQKLEDFGGIEAVYFTSFVVQ